MGSLEAETAASQWIRAAPTNDWNLLDEYTVSDVMTREVKSQPSRATVQQAPRYMLDSGIHRVLVMDERELRGIVTTTDIVRAIADGSVQT